MFEPPNWRMSFPVDNRPTRLAGTFDFVMTTDSSSPRFAFDRITTRQFIIAVLVMGLIVMGSNILVQYPINRWLTWGALSYPVAFVVADLLNRRFGPHVARRVAYIGFIVALIASFWVASPRIAIASGSAFLCAQLVRSE